MRAFISSILLLCSTLCLSAQDLCRISGKVVDKDGNAVEYAAVVISGNGIKPKGVQSTTDGSFALKAAVGEYTLEVSLIGYEKFNLTLQLSQDTVLKDIVLQDDVRMLAGAKVAANRIEYNNTGYEYKISSIAALQSLDLSDVLKTAPGLSVTSKQLLLYGKRISNVYVDRRRVKLTEDELINYLNGFQGYNIEKIEVISDPDVSALHPGTAIRITTKKQTGGIGSMSARMNGSNTKFLVSPNLNVTYQRGKMQLYTSASDMYMTSNSEESVISEWNTEDRKESDLTYSKACLPLSANATVGVSYDLGKNDYLSAEVSHRELHRHQERELITEKTMDGSSSSETKKGLYNATYSTPTASLMYEHTFKDASVLTVTSDFVGSYRLVDITGDIAQGKDANNTSTFAGYAGYSRRFNNKHNMSAGMRYTYIGNEASDDVLSFKYNESVLSPFASYSYSAGKIGASAGLEGNFADIGGSTFTDITPSVSLNYYISRSQGHRLRASYSIDVTRPAMSELNPNAVLSDRTIYITVGNTELKSYRTNNYALDLTLFNDYTLNTLYSAADNAIASYLYSDDEGNIYQTYVNGGTKRYFGTTLFTSLKVSKNLSLRINASYKWTESTIGTSRKNYNTLWGSISADLTLPKRFSLAMRISADNGEMDAHNALLKTIPSGDIEIRKSIGRWRIGLEVMNLFDNGNGRTTIIDMGDYTKTVSSRTTNRSLQFNASYNFSWGKAGMGRRVESQKMELSNRIGQ